MSKRCENEIQKAINAERERIAKYVCAMCHHDVPRNGHLHIIQLGKQETVGTWIECLARGVFDPSFVKPERRPKPEPVAEPAPLADVGPQ
jgi:hypothetical protein